MNMSKIANDLRLMASGPYFGFREIRLPERQPGSSIMVGKVNPVMPELINQVAFQVMGNDHTICLAAEAGQLELNVMGPVLIFNLMQSITIMNNAFNVFDEKCVRGIWVDEQDRARLNRKVNNSSTVATALNSHLEYALSSDIAKIAKKTGVSVKEICMQEDIAKRIAEIRGGKPLTEEELDIILDPMTMTELGIPGAELLRRNI